MNTDVYTNFSLRWGIMFFSIFRFGVGHGKKNIKIEINFTREGAVLGELKGEMRVDMIVFNYIHV